MAVLLVTQSSAGTNFVFHYPPNPQIDNSVGQCTWDDANTDDRSSSSSDPSDDELDEQGASDAETGMRKMLENLDFETVHSESDRRSRSYAGGRQSSRPVQEHEDDHEDDDEEDNDAAKGEVIGPPWETVFGFNTGFLASLLAPKTPMCRTKFELTIDDLVFLGYPVNIRPDGTWRKQRKRKKAREVKSNASELTVGIYSGAGLEKWEGKKTQDHEGETGCKEDDETAGNEADDEDEPGDDPRSDVEEEDKEEWEEGMGMSMFHVVFVMNPPQLEYHSRVHEMYFCVVKKFARALKLEQVRTEYVRKEMELILKMKEKAIHDGKFNCSKFKTSFNIDVSAGEDSSFQDLWQNILASSNLASAIASIFCAISASKIAHVYINDSIDLSLQLPMVQEMSILPSPTEPQIPGLYGLHDPSIHVLF